MNAPRGHRNRDSAEGFAGSLGMTDPSNSEFPRLPVLTEEKWRELIAGKPELTHLILCEGERWRLYLNPSQHLLGRAHLWLTSRHVDFHPFDDLTAGEVFEMMELVHRYHTVLRRLWKPTMLNVSWFGNQAFGDEGHRGHGNLHLVPRYAEPASFDGRSFPDSRFGSNYHPYKAPILTDEQLTRIVQTIRAELA